MPVPKPKPLEIRGFWGRDVSEDRMPEDARCCRNCGCGSVKDAVAQWLLDADPDLSRLVDVWPPLPEHVRLAILALAGTAA
jgi:hypothetical protein